MRLNLVFHNIVKSKNEIKNEFTITIEFFIELQNKINQLVRSKLVKFKEVCFYFDDGYKSFLTKILPLFKNETKNLVLAIPVENIGKTNYLNWQQLKLIHKSDVKIASHGISHTALAVYKGNQLQVTPTNESYQNSLQGKKRILTAKEVFFQLNESKKIIEQTLKSQINEFVLPYGLYNKNTLEIWQRSRLYKYLTTCDPYLDKGQKLRPRYLIDNKKSLARIIQEISKLNLKKH